MCRVNRRVAVAAVVALAAAPIVTAGIVVEDKPVALVTANLVMNGGRPFVRLADLARALGGTGRYDAVHRSYEILPGSGGALIANPGLFSALGPGGDPGRLGGRLVATQNAFRLSIGGRDVGIEEEERVMLRPADPGVSLSFLARMLGGTARFDPGKGSWVLPPGGPGTPLRFR